jgi:hypothetical protein
MAQIKNMQEAIAVLEETLAYLRRKEFRDSGRPAPDFSALGAIKVKDAPVDED